MIPLPNKRVGAPRITTIIKLGTRTDRQQMMEQKVESVLGKLETTSPSPGQPGVSPSHV